MGQKQCVTPRKGTGKGWLYYFFRDKEPGINIRVHCLFFDTLYVCMYTYMSAICGFL